MFVAIFFLLMIFIESALPSNGKILVFLFPTLAYYYFVFDRYKNLLIYLAFFITIAHNSNYILIIILFFIYFFTLEFFRVNIGENKVTIFLMTFIQLILYLFFIRLDIDIKYLILHIIGFIILNIFFNKYYVKE